MKDACILGLDALRIFGIKIDFSKLKWSFATNLLIEYDFETEDQVNINFASLNGLKELDLSERERLEQFLKEKLSPEAEKPGKTRINFFD